MSIVNYIVMIAVAIMVLACNTRETTTTVSESPSVEVVPSEPAETQTESVVPTVEETTPQEQNTLNGESVETTTEQTSTEVVMPPDEHLDC